jgi:hypothetical protein
MSARDGLTESQKVIYDELLRECLPRHPNPKPAKLVEKITQLRPKEEVSEAERWRRAAEHNRALLRRLREEKQRAIAAEVERQRQIDWAWEQSRLTQQALDELYASTCHRGPGDGDWGL